MKKIVIGVVVVCVLALIGLSLIGLSPWALKANIDVGIGMGAKLACSGRYVSGFDDQRIYSDLASYTPATDLLTITHDDQARRTDVSLFGFSASATYRPNLGCTRDIGDTSRLDKLVVEPVALSNAEWPAGDTVASIDTAVQTALENLLAQDNATGLDTRALLVVKNGQVVGEAYGPGITSDTPLLGWSMGKSLTAIMLGYLNYLGDLEPSEDQLFPAWQDDERGDVTIENLLQMASGLAFDETYRPGTDATLMLFSVHDAAAVAREQPQVYAPGTHFAYSSGTTNLLSYLFRERSGGVQRSFTRLFNQILSPLAMTHTYLEPDPSGTFVGSSYAYLSARDWARLGQLMLNEGELNGKRLLHPEWVTASRQPNKSDGPRYGYQFWLNDGSEALRWPSLARDAYAMMGNREQVVMMIPSANAVIVRLGWSATSYPTDTHFAQIVDILGK